MWLPQTADGCYLTASKVHDWWRHAASLRVAHIAKVDEDSFVHVPNLEEEVRRLHCVRLLNYGAGAFAGYHPTRYNMCGFSWRGAGSYNKYGCAKGGAHPAFPFMMGGLQLLSLPLAAHLGGSRAVGEFVARSDAEVDYGRLAASAGKLTINDDVMVGFWMADAQRRGLLPNVSYVFINERAKNVECDVADCAKRSACSLYGVPSNRSVLVHNLKGALMQPYTWAVVRGDAAHDAVACKLFFVAKPKAASVGGLEPVRRWVAEPRATAARWFRRPPSGHGDIAQRASAVAAVARPGSQSAFQI